MTDEILSNKMTTITTAAATAINVGIWAGQYNKWI